MYPGTRARRVAAESIPPDITGERRLAAVRCIHRGLLQAHHQSIHECANIAIEYGRDHPSAYEAAHCITKRILKEVDLYPLSQIDRHRRRS